MIELEHIYKRFEQKDFPVEALQDVSLRVGKGEVYGVVGPSGAGKSTLIRCVNLLERPDRTGAGWWWIRRSSPRFLGKL